MRAHRNKKKTPDEKKKPVGVGHPSELDTCNHFPKNPWNNLYVSGFATRKYTRVVYAAYFALSAIFTFEYGGGFDIGVLPIYSSNLIKR